ncbi:MAG: PQQ-like beta-propeller repeat protein, partial [Chloroflexi bacterium]|nr:PQQ-like beta-propeller repeat protein [Chloroflexota bacterium]
MDAQTDENSWPMLAANPERTSWTPEEVRGRLKPVWYRPIEPYINPKTQVIAANGLLYISTAGGLYALDAENGDVAWVYPTELPLGHSPTVVGNILYVGGYDRKIYAINAVPDLSTLPRQQGYRINNQTIWVFDEAEAGFETNPLVVDGRLYAGNRDGHLYALNAATGELLWKFKTDGPILFSCAYKDGVLYFASNDSHAYAVSTDGRLIWKSAKLPGAGFHAYWPVIYTNPQTKRTYVVLGGSENYSDDNNSSGIGVGSLGNSLDNSALYVDSTGARLPDGALVGAVGTEPGDWAAQTVTIDASRIAQYLESNTGSDDNDSSNGLNKPWRRTYFVLDALTGHEFTFDSDGDGKPEYAPIAWLGTHSGNRYPAVIGSDGILYQANSYIANQYIPRGGISGWKFGTQFISRVHDGNYGAVDEPLAYSAGGNLIYWSLCCDREAGGYDITIPYGTGGRYWEYWDYNLGTLCPGLAGDCSAYGGQNGVYGAHGTVNPPIPYRGRLYKIASNAVIALGPEGGAVALGMVPTIDTQDKAEPIPAAHLKQLLAEEIQKMIDAGHLRPGYYSSVLGEWHLAGANWNFLTHYFHNPGETFYTLARAIPHLPWTLQQKAKDYLQQEYESYSQYNHIGWKNGAAREILDAPPEVQA